MELCDWRILTELKISATNVWPQAGGAVRSTAQFDVRIAYADRRWTWPPETRTAAQGDRRALQKAIGSKETQLGNETFRSRAPEKIIRGLEATLAEQRVETAEVDTTGCVQLTQNAQ